MREWRFRSGDADWNDFGLGVWFGSLRRAGDDTGRERDKSEQQTAHCWWQNEGDDRSECEFYAIADSFAEAILVA
jgi:hypothetical protein